MVIETENAIIIIEAKINHVLNNNLVIYAEYAEELAKKKGRRITRKSFYQNGHQTLWRVSEKAKNKKNHKLKNRNWILGRCTR